MKLSKNLPLRVPYNIYIDPSNACNFKCTFCPTGNKELLKSVDRPLGIMKFNVFEKIVNDLSEMIRKYNQKPEFIALFKDGEPLLNKNLIPMISLLDKNKLSSRIHLTTNGSLINKYLSEKLVSSGLKEIRFSIYHVNEKGYFGLTRKKVNFKNLVEKLKEFWEINKCFGSPINVRIHTIDVNYTKSEKEEFKNIFEKISNTIKFEPLHGWSSTETLNQGGTMTPQFLKEKKICAQPFSRMTVLHNGDVTPCCVDWSHKLVQGNVMNESLDKIWNQNCNKLRLDHINNKIKRNSPCFNCEYLEQMSEEDSLDGEEKKLLAIYN